MLPERVKRGGVQVFVQGWTDEWALPERLLCHAGPILEKVSLARHATFFVDNFFVFEFVFENRELEDAHVLRPYS